MTLRYAVRESDSSVIIGEEGHDALLFWVQAGCLVDKYGTGSPVLWSSCTRGEHRWHPVTEEEGLEALRKLGLPV